MVLELSIEMLELLRFIPTWILTQLKHMQHLMKV